MCSQKVGGFYRSLTALDQLGKAVKWSRQREVLGLIRRIRQVKDGAFDAHQFLFEHPHPDTKIDPRQHATIAQLRKGGWTLQRTADRFGVTRQRIDQILKEQNRD